jgi:hypothetical protein
MADSETITISDATEAAAILSRIKAQYRPYDTLPEFTEGFDAYQARAAHRRNPYEDGRRYGGVKAQAWDRGANAAMLYRRALVHLDAHREDVDSSTPFDKRSGAQKAGPSWLARLLRTGRC